MCNGKLGLLSHNNVLGHFLFFFLLCHFVHTVYSQYEVLLWECLKYTLNVRSLFIHVHISRNASNVIFIILFYVDVGISICIKVWCLVLCMFRICIKFSVMWIVYCVCVETKNSMHDTLRRYFTRLYFGDRRTAVMFCLLRSGAWGPQSCPGTQNRSRGGWLDALLPTMDRNQPSGVCNVMGLFYWHAERRDQVYQRGRLPSAVGTWGRTNPPGLSQC